MEIGLPDQGPLAPRIGAVILNWNLPHQTLACVRSLRESTLKVDSLLVVDNGSTDDSVMVLRRELGADDVLDLQTNTGFSGGMNAGIRAMRNRGMDYMLIMNNDVSVAPDMLQKLVDAAAADASCLIAAPVVYWANPQDRVWHAGSRFGRILLLPWRVRDAEAARIATTRVDAVPAAVWLLSEKAVDSVGVFDASYFMYYEDWDYCWRARIAGFHIVVVGGARAWHAVSASTRSIPGFRHYHFSRGRARFYLSHGSLFSRSVFFVALALSDVRAAVGLLLRGEYGAMSARLGGFRAGVTMALKGGSGGQG